MRYPSRAPALRAPRVARMSTRPHPDVPAPPARNAHGGSPWPTATAAGTTYAMPSGRSSEPTTCSAAATSTPSFRRAGLRRRSARRIRAHHARWRPSLRRVCSADMRVIVLGAGHVGRTLVDALHEEHDLTVIDTNGTQLSGLADQYDVRVVQGDGTTRSVMVKAGIEDTDLVIAGSPREEANLVCAILAKRLSGAKTVVRTTSIELLDAWREGELDVDCMISPELETARAIAGVVGLPAARQTDAFAEGQVQIVEFDVEPDAPGDGVIGRRLRDRKSAV